MAHISDELYGLATEEFIKTNPEKLCRSPLVRDQVQAMFHDEIIRLADVMYQQSLPVGGHNVCGS